MTEGFTFTDARPDPALRAELEGKTTEELYALLREKTGVTLTGGEENNRHRLMRSVEKALSGRWESPPPCPRYDCLLLGVTFPREEVCRASTPPPGTHRRGMLDEVAELRANGATDAFLEGLGLEYRYILRYLTGQIPTLDGLKDELAGPSSASPSGRWCGSKRTGTCCGWTWRGIFSPRPSGPWRAFWPEPFPFS